MSGAPFRAIMPDADTDRLVCACLTVLLFPLATPGAVVNESSNIAKLFPDSHQPEHGCDKRHRFECVQQLCALAFIPRCLHRRAVYISIA